MHRHVLEGWPFCRSALSPASCFLSVPPNKLPTMRRAAWLAQAHVLDSPDSSPRLDPSLDSSSTEDLFGPRPSTSSTCTADLESSESTSFVSEATEVGAEAGFNVSPTPTSLVACRLVHALKLSQHNAPSLWTEYSVPTAPQPPAGPRTASPKTRRAMTAFPSKRGPSLSLDDHATKTKEFEAKRP